MTFGNQLDYNLVLNKSTQTYLRKPEPVTDSTRQLSGVFYEAGAVLGGHGETSFTKSGAHSG